MARTFKVKLDSGRVLGPLDLERIRLLILKNQILGKELARAYPAGDWVKISAIPEIADLFIARAEGKLTKESTLTGTANTRGSAASTAILPGAGEIFSMDGVANEMKEVEIEQRAEPFDSSILDLPPAVELSEAKPPIDTSDRTMVATRDDQTMVGALVSVEKESSKVAMTDEDSQVALRANLPTEVSYEETVMLKAPVKKKRINVKEAIKAVIAAVALGVAGYQVFFSEQEVQLPMRPEPIRPTLPNFQQGQGDPGQSLKLYNEGMKAYVLDNVASYRTAAAKFSEATALDINNVKALALLASSYINLIDSSNKDENYFAVISKLIDLTRAKSMDLPETVIADVEFFCVVNKAEAAQNRVVEYSKTHPSIGLEMFYYLALSFYSRGDFQNASRYISQIPDNKAFSPKVFYLQGLIAEKLVGEDAALNAYEKALKMSSLHAKSRLRIADIKNQRGRIQEAKTQLVFLVAHPMLLSPKDLGFAYYLHSIFSEQNRDYEVALGDAERAVQLNKDDHSYLLQLYSMRAKAGESIANIRKDAKMYYFLGEGERVLKAGKVQEALTQFLQARQSNNDSPIPLVKIGDMFSYLHDLGNARLNYKMAADRAPDSISIWSKYIDVLIQSFEWDEANKAMDRFRELPVSQSAIDKAAGDMYAKQGQYDKAQVYYRKAMARESIDADVYIAYAKSLMETRNFKEAPFFFALAQRYDPLNVDAIIGTAKCIANTDSIDRAVSLLQDELQKGTGARAELLAAVAEFQIQKGTWELAQRTIEDAMSANPDYAYPWKLQAQVYMNNETKDRKAMDKALFAYQSYSDRNASDPSGYLERYRIFLKKREYDKATDELAKIYSTYPKYPNLHFYKGALYSLMGNHKVGIEEYKAEIQNNPGSVDAMLALGKEYIELGGLNEALGQFNKAMQTNPNLAEPKHMSGYANYLLKNYAGAIALYQAAIAKDPGNPLIYKRLGLAYQSVGDNQNAAMDFKKYIQMEPDAPDRAEFERYR